MLDDLDLTTFWEDSDDISDDYTEAPLTPELVRSVEQELGFRLPASYVALMRSQNGGVPARTCFATTEATSWAADHIAITGFLGIGRDKPCSLLGEMGSRFMQEEWGYPSWGVCICDCPSAGHDLVMLDYRECGPDGEPAVVHVDQESDYHVTFLAPDFETFVRGLVSDSVYDTSEADLKAALDGIEHGRFSSALTRLLAASSAPGENEKVLRALLRTIASEKGYFALHSDPQSHLVYDLLFTLAATAGQAPTAEAFLKAYPDLLAFGDGDVSTGGYAPGFIEDWLKARLTAGAIVERNGRLALSDAHRSAVEAQLAAFR